MMGVLWVLTESGHRRGEARVWQEFGAEDAASVSNVMSVHDWGTAGHSPHCQ